MIERIFQIKNKHWRRLLQYSCYRHILKEMEKSHLFRDEFVEASKKYLKNPDSLYEQDSLIVSSALLNSPYLRLSCLENSIPHPDKRELMDYLQEVKPLMENTRSRGELLKEEIKGKSRLVKAYEFTKTILGGYPEEKCLYNIRKKTCRNLIETANKAAEEQEKKGQMTIYSTNDPSQLDTTLKDRIER